MGSFWKLSLCLTEPMPASSKLDPLLARAQSFSDGGNTSGITYLRGKLLHNSGWKEGLRTCKRNNTADTRVNEEGGEGGSPGTRAEIFQLQPVMKPMVRQPVPLQSMKIHSGADLHLQPVEDPMLEQGVARRRLRSPGEPTLEQSSDRTPGPVGEPHCSSLFLKDCTP